MPQNMRHAISPSKMFAKPLDREAEDRLGELETMARVESGGERLMIDIPIRSDTHGLA